VRQVEVVRETFHTRGQYQIVISNGIVIGNGLVKRSDEEVAAWLGCRSPS